MQNKNENNNVNYSNVVNALHRASNKQEIQQYFEKVLELKQSGKKFPVNFDEVWPLIYIGRHKAVEVLKSDFVENEDYVLLTQKGKQKRRGGHNRVNYCLTIACMEYFVAKKVKPVFEVYRRVFHQAVSGTIHGKQNQEMLPEQIEAQNDRRVIVALMNSNPRKNTALVVSDYYRQKNATLARIRGEVAYNYTAQEMLNIIESIIEKPVDKHKLLTLLKVGRM